MAVKISALTNELTAPADDDILPIVDTSEPETKRITTANLRTSMQAGVVPTSRTISTTAPLTGGGDLSADRTLGIDTAAVPAGPLPYRVLDANAAILSTDRMILINGTIFTLTLPDPTTLPNGWNVWLRGLPGVDLAAGPVTLAPNGAEEINGVAASRSLATMQGSWFIWTENQNWFLLAAPVTAPLALVQPAAEAALSINAAAAGGAVQSIEVVDTPNSASTQVWPTGVVVATPVGTVDVTGASVEGAQGLTCSAAESLQLRGAKADVDAVVVDATNPAGRVSLRTESTERARVVPTGLQAVENASNVPNYAGLTNTNTGLSVTSLLNFVVAGTREAHMNASTFTPSTDAGLDLGASSVGWARLYMQSASGGSAGSPLITKAGDADTGVFWPIADTIALAAGGTEVARFLAGAFVASGYTALRLAYDPGTGVVLDDVSVGAADSGGSGFRVLRVPN